MFAVLTSCKSLVTKANHRRCSLSTTINITRCYVGGGDTNIYIVYPVEHFMHLLTLYTFVYFFQTLYQFIHWTVDTHTYTHTNIQYIHLLLQSTTNQSHFHIVTLLIYPNQIGLGWLIMVNGMEFTMNIFLISDFWLMSDPSA